MSELVPVDARPPARSDDDRHEGGRHERRERHPAEADLRREDPMGAGAGRTRWALACGVAPWQATCRSAAGTVQAAAAWEVQAACGVGAVQACRARERLVGERR